MPRRRRGQLPTGAARHRPRGTRPDIDGLSARTMSEIFRLEADRSYLCPGDVGTALRLWKNHVRRPERLLWQDHEGGDLYGECCGDPHEARILLDTVTAALSPRGARELRGVVGRWDAVWNRVSRPHGPRSG